MIDHFNLPVSDLAESLRFHELILAPLGYRSLLQDGDAVGFGVDSWAFGIDPNGHNIEAVCRDGQVDR